MIQDSTTGPFRDFGSRISGYLPTLTGGLVVLTLGVVAGWVVKRAVVRLMLWLRLDRLASRQGWRAAFGKGDVRAALSEGIGTVVGTLVTLLFLDNALEIWGLTVLSRLLDRVLFYLPNLALVALIIGIGVLLSNALADRVVEALEEEEFAHPRLVGKIFKGILLSIVGALALWQLDLARQIVLAAFLIAFGAMGVAFALAVGLGSRQGLQQVWDRLLQRKDKA
jgi:Mechanosensitive ion channel, conserved TM helix